MTDKELIRALRLCSCEASTRNCPTCPLSGNDDCVTDALRGAADIIERLTAEVADLRKELGWKDMVIALAQRKQAEAEAERDALREKVPQWISVEERPQTDHSKKCLITFKDAGGSIVDAAWYIPGLGWECCNWDVPQDVITHRMPLPEAPEEGEKE